MKNFYLFNLVFLSVLISSTILSAQNLSITFNAALSTDLPAGETVCVYLLEREGTGGETVFPLTETSPGNWLATLQFDDNWLALGVTYHYKYCRNYIFNGADEVVNGDETAYRSFTMNSNDTQVNDSIVEWRWWPNDGVVQSINTDAYVTTPPSSLPDDTFQCGVELPDFWDHEFIHSVGATLDRIINSVKADYVEYNPIPEITQFYPKPIIDMHGNNSTPDDDLIQIITEAKSRGLKVYLDPYPWALNVQDNSPNSHSAEWWNAYEQQWRPIILYYAQISEQYGVNVLTFNMWPNRWNVTQDEAAIIEPLAEQLLKDVKQIYSGKIAVEFVPWGPNMDIYGMGDYLKFNIAAFWPYKLSTSFDPTVAEMVANLNTGFDELYTEGPQKWGKPILLSQISASSYNGTVLNQPDWETVSNWLPNDPDVEIDLQEQADVYEAFMEDITQRDWIAGCYSFGYLYQNSIDKEVSIRAKPAEDVLAKWYHWINPNGVTGVDEKQNIPKGFALYQNYPNPFNPSTIINYSIPVNGFVSLNVFNTLGQKIADLVNDKEPAGNYEISFDAQHLTSGIYFYRLSVSSKAKSFTQTKKMIVLK